MGEFVNTFSKGMTSDVSVVYQPDGTYRFLKNCQLISQDGNNYAVKDCLGNVLKFTINRPYNATINALADYPMPIGMISFPGKLIIISTNDESDNGGYGEIGQINYNPYYEGIQPIVVAGNYNDGYMPLYHSVNLKLSKKYAINNEAFSFAETESLERIYWTDNFNEPRTFNVNDPIFTTYIQSGNISATAGTEYMVLEGAVRYNGIDYGPGLTAGNIITTTGGIVVYTDLTSPNPTAKVIKNYPYQLLNFTPDRSLGNIKFNSYGTGTVNCGNKMYFYRLTDPASGLVTSWSYGSFPLHVGTTNSITSNPANAFFDFTGGGTQSALLNSGKSVKMDISNIDTNFTRIQMACAEYDQVLELPRQIVIVVDTLITGASMTLEHTGNVNIQTLTTADITLFPASILTCKTMTTNKNYILIGNIKEREEFVFDVSAITLSEIKGSFPVHDADRTSCPNVLTYTNLSPSIAANPTVIYYGAQYVVTSVAGGAITYNGNTYSNVGDVFTGVASPGGVFNIPAGSALRPCVYRNKYTTTSGTLRPDTIQFSSGISYWTYKNPAMVHHKLGYWANEKYRFGILFYDLKGNPFYVRWIGDLTINPIGAANDIMNRVTGSGSGAAFDDWFLNYRGVSVSGITIPAADIDKISGFSIVRAPRDKRIITEGMLMQCGANGTLFKPIAGPNPQTDSNWLGSVNSPKFNYYTLVCPDDLVAIPMTGYAPGSNLESVQFYSPQDYTGGGIYMKSVDVGYQDETRYFLAASDTVTRKQKIVNLTDVVEGAIITNFGTNSFMYQNNTQFQASPANIVDNSCVAPGTFDIGGYKAQAGKRTVLELDSFMYDYNSNTVAYGDLSSCNILKMIVDVTNDNNNQYGGNSDTAKANTIYISTGHFQPITAAVKADTLDVNGNYTFNNVHVFGGDCFVNLIDYGHSLHDDNISVTSNSWGLKFPCQSNTNWDLRRGRTVANNKMYKGVIDNGVWYNVGGTAHLESFLYNYGYSSFGSVFAYPALPVDFTFDNIFRYRIRFAGPKFPAEIVNSFRNFLINDYRDIDGQGGEINNLRTKDGRVIVWQNAITSTVPVLERQILTGLAGAPTTLGTGGVVDRYDPLNSYFGNQHHHGLTATEYGFAWFDMRRKAFVVMDIGAGIIEVSNILGLSGVFNEAFPEVLQVNNLPMNDLINSPTFDITSDQPLMGVGIVGVYDPKFKMTYLTFKWKQRSESGENVSYINKDFTVGYFHRDKIFIGLFDWTPAITHNHNQIVLSANNPKSKTQYFGPNMASTTFTVGEVVPWENAEYIVMADVTITSYPPTGNKVPDYPNSVYFKKINDTSQLWVHNQPKDLTSTEYQYNMFFGQVVNNEHEWIVNPKIGNSFSGLHMEQWGNGVNVTDVEISNDTQVAADSNIRPTSRFYRKIYEFIASNFPIATRTGRLTGSYLKVRTVKKNWSTDPTVMDKGIRILRFVKTFFEEKR